MLVAFTPPGDLRVHSTFPECNSLGAGLNALYSPTLPTFAVNRYQSPPLVPNPSRYSSRTPLLPPLRCLLGLQTGDLRGHPTLTLPERRSLGVDLSRTPSLETHYITVLLFSAYERWPQVFYFFMTGLAPLLTILLRSSTDSNQRRSRLPRVVSDTHLVLLVIYLKPYPSQTKLIVGFAIFRHFTNFGVRVSSHKSSGVYRALRASQLFTSLHLLLPYHMATNDDSGYIYENLRAPANLYDDFKDGNITYADLRPFIDVKWGYGHQQVIIWLGFFKVQRRVLAERRVHDAIRALVPPVVYPCVGCSVRHREYYPLEEILAEGSGAHDSHSKSRLERRANGDDANPSSSSTASSPRCAPDYSPMSCLRTATTRSRLASTTCARARRGQHAKVGSRNAMDGACIRPAASAEARAYSPVVRFRQVYPEVNLGVYLRVHLQVILRSAERWTFRDAFLK
ncbi:hypothetical protein C8R43DRAFT_1143028 [Mycena crocata]|nr:hypothetical protein C8R43DRAFT_1143028 [Mycena crocata]